MTTKTETALIFEPLFVDRAQITLYTTLSATTWDTLVARGEAPKPRKLSGGRVAWLFSELKTWGQSQPKSDLLPPAGSGHGRAGKKAQTA